VIAHRISIIRSADRIVAIKDGRIVGKGTYEELMKNCPYFRTLIGEEFNGKSEN
jgi:ABC-type multidrug transport system fused ATPase/permease subunit